MATNCTIRQNLLNGITENYSYDKLYELTQVLQGANTTESYNYDAAGNRLSSIGFNPLSYNSSNELVSSPTTSFTYDSNGNMTSKATSSGTTSYTWDYENRLKQVTLPGTSGTVNFAYDPFGRRIQKKLASGSTIYLYDGANIVAEVNSSGAIQASYVQGAGIDEPLAMQRGGNIAYYQADGLGSITSLTDPTAKTISTYTYHAFGSTTATEGIFNPFRYTAREQDPETGLYYYRARYYDPSIGRFISEDPIGFRAGVDFYAYVRNNPIMLSDPTGTCQIDSISGYYNSCFNNSLLYPDGKSQCGCICAPLPFDGEACMAKCTKCVGLAKVVSPRSICTCACTARGDANCEKKCKSLPDKPLK